MDTYEQARQQSLQNLGRIKDAVSQPKPPSGIETYFKSGVSLPKLKEKGLAAPLAMAYNFIVPGVVQDIINIPSNIGGGIAQIASGDITGGIGRIGKGGLDLATTLIGGGASKGLVKGVQKTVLGGALGGLEGAALKKAGQQIVTKEIGKGALTGAGVAGAYGFFGGLRDLDKVPENQRTEFLINNTLLGAGIGGLAGGALTGFTARNALKNLNVIENNVLKEIATRNYDDLVSAPLNKKGQYVVDIIDEDLKKASLEAIAGKPKGVGFLTKTFRPVKQLGKNMEDAYVNWVNTRNATGAYSFLRFKDFRNYVDRGIQGILDFEKDASKFPGVKKYFDDMYQTLVKANILKEGQYFDEVNYLPLMFTNTKEEVAAAFEKKRRLSTKPSFAFERVLQGYNEGVALGLTPRFNNIAEIVQFYEKTARKAIADKNFFNTLISNRWVVPVRSAPADWVELDAGFPKYQSIKKEKNLIEKTIPDKNIEIKRRAKKSNSFSEFVKKELPGVYYHGTKGKFNTLEKTSQEFLNTNSLYGPGLYLTDDYNVAASYTKKGIGEVGEVLAGKPTLNKNQILNLEEDVPQNIKKIFSDLIVHYEGKIPQTNKGTELYSIFKNTVKDYLYENDINDPEEFSEALRFVNNLIYDEGYRALSHIGGRVTKSKLGEHNVLIMLGDSDAGGYISNIKNIDKNKINTEIQNLKKIWDERNFSTELKQTNLIDTSFIEDRYAAPPEFAQVINNYLASRDDGIMASIGKFYDGVKQRLLTAGIPLTGINFHGFSTLMRYTFGSGKNPFTSVAQGLYFMINPNAATKRIEKSLELVPEAVQAGLTVSEGSLKKLLYTKDQLRKEFEAEFRDKNFAQKNFAKVWNWYKGIVEDPLMEQVIPAYKIETWKNTYNTYKAYMPDAQARRTAAEFTNTLLGGLNYDAMGRSQEVKNLMKFVLLAPDWFETNVNLGVRSIKSVWDTDKNYRAYRRFAANFVGSYLFFNAINKAMSGKYMWENEPGQKFSIDTGTKDEQGNTRYIQIYGTGADFLRLPVDAIDGIINGDTGVVSRLARNRLSPLGSTLVSFYSNTDYAGRPIYGTDKFGNPLTPTQTAFGISSLAGQFLGVPTIFGEPTRNILEGVLTGKKVPLERSIVEAVDLPVRYKAQVSDITKLQRQRTEDRKALERAILNNDVVTAQTLSKKFTDREISTLVSNIKERNISQNLTTREKLFNRLPEQQKLELARTNPEFAAMVQKISALETQAEVSPVNRFKDILTGKPTIKAAKAKKPRKIRARRLRARKLRVRKVRPVKVPRLRTIQTP